MAKSYLLPQELLHFYIGSLSIEDFPSTGVMKVTIKTEEMGLTWVCEVRWASSLHQDVNVWEALQVHASCPIVIPIA